MIMHRKIGFIYELVIATLHIHTKYTIQSQLATQSNKLHTKSVPEGRVAVGQLQCHHALGAFQRQGTNCGELKHTIVLVHLCMYVC